MLGEGLFHRPQEIREELNLPDLRPRVRLEPVLDTTFVGLFASCGWVTCVERGEGEDGDIFS